MSTVLRKLFSGEFFGAGACTTMLARAMIRDLFARTRAAQMLSTLVLVMAISPIAGPLIWRTNYSPEHLALFFGCWR